MLPRKERRDAAWTAYQKALASCGTAENTCLAVAVRAEAALYAMSLIREACLQPPYNEYGVMDIYRRIWRTTFYFDEETEKRLKAMYREAHAAAYPGCPVDQWFKDLAGGST
jgi:hypothetical protein